MIHKATHKTSRLPTPIKWNVLACGLVIDWLLTFTKSWNSSRLLYAVICCTWNLFINYSTHFLSAPNTHARMYLIMYIYVDKSTNVYIFLLHAYYEIHFKQINTVENLNTK